MPSKTIWLKTIRLSSWNRGKIMLAQLAFGDASAILTALHKSQAIIEFKLDGTIITANANFLNAMGYRLDEVQGKHHSMFVEPAYRDSTEYKRFWESLRAGEYHAERFKRLGKGGKEVWIEASYNPVCGKSGKPYKVIKFATDITVQKNAEADLQGQVAAIGRSQAVIQFDLTGKILDANENFLQAMGYRLDEIKGQHHSIFVEPAYRDSAEYKRFWERLRAGEYQAAQYKRIGKGGRQCWIEASYNPILDANGRPYKVVKFATDITKRKDDNAKLADDLERNVKNILLQLTTSSNRMEETAAALAASAEETNNQSATVSSASEQLAASINEIARQLTEASNVINSAVSGAHKSEQTVAELVGAADKIGAVTQMINDIASQTNLLALNATIEAARAGEMGKGFAVVASEVKSLATQTGKATDEIAQQIKGIQDSSQTTAVAIREIAAIIGRVNEISTSISGAVEEQSAATREVSANISGVTQAAEDTGRSSTTVLDVSHDLARQAVELQDWVSKFVATVRAM
jgi:methyl-accepting chemotaxis protein